MKETKMNSTRRKRLVGLAIDHLYYHSEIAEEMFNLEEDYEANPKRIELEIAGFNGNGSKIMFSPIVDELDQIVEKGTNGNWRTRELVYLAIRFIQENIDELFDLYYYTGESERFMETHISFDDNNFLCPTTEEFKELIDDIDKIVKMLPAVNAPSIAWRIFDIVEDEEARYLPRREYIDTVFFAANCNSQYVTDSLINHDFYNSSIRIVC